MSSEEGSSEELDLDWLPDPDKIYGEEATDSGNLEKSSRKNSKENIEDVQFSTEVQTDDGTRYTSTCIF